MNRTVAVVGGAIILIAAVAVGGLMTMDSENNAPSNSAQNTTPVETPTPDDDAVLGGTPNGDAPRETPTDNSARTPTSTPAPAFHPDDPGAQSYPRNPGSIEEEIVWSSGLSDHLDNQITTYREGNPDLSKLGKSTSFKSTARAHSYDMYERGFLSATTPDGTTPTEQYDGLRMECSDVTRYVFEETRVVETADGEQKDTSGEEIAADIFYEMRNNQTMHDSLMNASYDGLGIGTYVVGGENDDGATEVTVHVTVDYCVY